MRVSLCNILGFQSTLNIGKYLGAYLPSKISEGIDRVNRNFLWGSSETAKKTHWVNWEKVTKTKEKGGLGSSRLKEEIWPF